MEKRNFHGIDISIYQLISAKNCSKKGEILNLGLLTTHEHSLFRQEILKTQGRYLGEPEAPQKVEQFLYENACRKWYHMDTEYDVILKEEAAYHKRLASFFVGQKRIAENVPWSYPIALTIGGTQIDSVFGYACAIVEEEKGHIAIILADSNPVYTAHAIKKENCPEYAPELIGA